MTRGARAGACGIPEGDVAPKGGRVTFATVGRGLVRACGFALLLASGLRIDPVLAARSEAPKPAPSPTPPAERIRALLGQSYFLEAEARARELLGTAQAEHGPESPESIAALDLLVEALWRGGKTDQLETLRLAGRAVELKERSGADPLGLAISLNNLGIVASDRGERAEARRAYQRAIEIRESVYGPSHPETARIRNNLGIVCLAEGDYAAAESLFTRAAQARESSDGPDHPEVALSLTNLALTLHATGDHARARSLNERCVAIREKSLGPEHFLTAMSRSFLAGSLTNLGDYDRALPLYQRALATVERVLPAGHPALARVLDDLGSALEATGRLGRAREVYERALAVREATHGVDHAHVAESLHRLAGALHSLGEPARAESLYLQATEIRRRALGPHHAAVADGLEDLARLGRERGHGDRGASLEQSVLAIRLRALGPAHPDVGRILQRIAARHFASGRHDAALETALAAEAITREHVRLMARVLPERGALRFSALRTRSLDLIVSVACASPEPERARRAWDAVIRSRAMVFDEMAARRRSVAFGADSTVDRLTAEAISARTRLANLIVRGAVDQPVDSFRQHLDDVREGSQRAERKLAERSSVFRSEQGRRQIGFDEVAVALPPRSALVAYFRYERVASAGAQAYAAFVIRAEAEFPEAIALGPAAQIDSLVARWSEEAGRTARGIRRLKGEVSYREVGRALSRRVWEPVARRLAAVERLVIVPDGALSLVNFAALPVGATRYLIETGPLLEYFTAERDLVASADFQGRPPPRHDLLVLASPDFGSSSVSGGGVGARAPGRRPDCGDFRSLWFAPLPATRDEARMIESLWSRSAAGTPRPLILTDAAASEETFKRAAPTSRVLHLATHGFFLGRGCPSALQASRDPRRESRSPAAVMLPVLGESPLLLSGLALAGANRHCSEDSTGEDGVLTAEEITALELGSVECAVLSACETGTGQLSEGEGVFGLRRAFQLAGAASVVMSLWAVEDQASREWMGEFYRAWWFGRLRIAEAVHRASLTTLQSRRRRGSSTHPFGWAAFVGTGR